MKLPIYELKISEDVQNDAEVNFIALVDAPAIKQDYLVFSEQFIEPSKGEHQTDFLPRCIKYVIDEGKDSEQAVAICNSIWDEHFAEDSYNDYPQAASDNAQTALNWAEKNGWGSCGTPVGKIRANQLANKESISRDTIARMAGFERHRQNSNKPLGDGCGRLMWLAWGGDEGIAWAQRKLKQIDGFAANKVSFDYDDTLSTSRGKELAKKEMDAGNTIYIISARSDASAMYATADELGIPHSKVYATGSNKAKVEKVKELGINKHYDNNADVIKELGSVGQKFLQYAFAIQNEDEHIITGVIMVPDQLIYRTNERFGEHYVRFSAQTIKDIAIKFSKKGYQKNVNLMHDANMQVDGVTMFESFISDSQRGIKPIEAFKDLPDGTWFGSFYVENPKVWELIKQGQVKGFSVEGLFDYEAPMSEDMKKLMELKEILNTFHI